MLFSDIGLHVDFSISRIRTLRGQMVCCRHVASKCSNVGVGVYFNTNHRRQGAVQYKRYGFCLPSYTRSWCEPHFQVSENNLCWLNRKPSIFTSDCDLRHSFLTLRAVGFVCEAYIHVYRNQPISPSCSSISSCNIAHLCHV